MKMKGDKMTGITEKLTIFALSSIIAWMGVSHITQNRDYQVVVFFMLFVPIFGALLLLLVSDKIKSDKRFRRQPWNMGSKANYYNQTAGFVWTSAQIIHNKMSKGKLEINNFRYSREVKKELYFDSLFPYESKIMTKEPLSLTRGTLVCGQAGSGKTVFFKNILSQNDNFDFFSRGLIHDTKGDYTEIFYSKGDIILNPYDSRNSVWNFFGESDFNAVQIFFKVYMASMLGNEVDFWSSSSKDRYMEIIKIIFHKKDLKSKQKWGLFISELQEYFAEVAKLEKGSEKDVASTMKLQFEFFEIQNYLIQNGATTFTIRNFLSNKGKNLFLLNAPLYSDNLTPYFSGFLAAYVSILCSEPDTTENLTLLLLDELLTLLPALDDNTIKQLFTLIRSKGGVLFSGVQFLPEHSGNKNISQYIINSAGIIMIFELTDPYTVKKLQEAIGQATYHKTSKSNSQGKNANSKSQSISTEKTNIIPDDGFSHLNYSHLYFDRSENILYLGKTKRNELTNINSPFNKNKMIEKFYISKDKK